MAGLAWSEEEVALLQRDYAAHGKYMEALPQRTPWAKAGKAKQLGIVVHPPISKELSEAERRIAAWSIAWEGHISLFLVPRRSRYVPVVGIVNTDRSLILQFRELVGGGVLFEQAQRTERRKSTCGWKLSGSKNVAPFLRQIEAHLPAKRRQAQALLEFCERRRRDAPYDEIDAAIWAEMRELNRKGPR